MKEQLDLIAYEIHDGACQYLTSARMMFDMFRREHTSALQGNWRAFEIGMEFLAHADGELRRLACGLRPIHLGAGDLRKAVECLIEEIRATDGRDIELCCDIERCSMSERVELAVFRIVQELLAKPCHHGKSQRILVGLSQDQDDNSFCIQVQDWGTGFDCNRIPNGRLGMEGIRRRVRLLHGTLTISSEHGKGTLITVDLPLTDLGDMETLPT